MADPVNYVELEDKAQPTFKEVVDRLMDASYIRFTVSLRLHDRGLFVGHSD